MLVTCLDEEKKVLKTIFFSPMQQDISKRLSLPADLRIPESFLAKQSSSSPIFDGPLTRTNRRQSLSEIGFGRMETYTKLDKLGEVSTCLFSFLFPYFPWTRFPLIVCIASRLVNLFRRPKQNKRRNNERLKNIDLKKKERKGPLYLVKPAPSWSRLSID